MATRPAERQVYGSGFRIARLLLPFGWMLATAGYYGPWIAHKTATLTLTGSDMGEFVKFLPGALDGSLRVIRQLFYLPPMAIALSVALLLGNRSLGYPLLLRIVALVLSVVLSIQLLPPAWSPASLVSVEFRLQPIALGICWLALAGFWFLGRLPIRLTGLISSGLAVSAGVLSAWQILAVKPAIDGVYGIPLTVGWGCVVCLTGLAILAGAGAILALLAGSQMACSRHNRAGA
jgi:hypothetical protein